MCLSLRLGKNRFNTGVFSLTEYPFRIECERILWNCGRAALFATPRATNDPFPEPRYLRRIMGFYFESANEFNCQPARRCSAPAALAHALGPDSLRRHRDSAGRADVGVRGAQRPRTRARGYDDPDRDGGDAVHRHQLWPHGARLSQRRLGLHLRRPGNQSRSWLRDRLEHGDGLHTQSDYLHHLVQPAGACICSRRAVLGVGCLFCAGVHAPEHSGSENLGSGEFGAGSGDGRGDCNFLCGRGALHLRASARQRRLLYPSLLRSDAVEHEGRARWNIDRGAHLHWI